MTTSHQEVTLTQVRTAPCRLKPKLTWILQIFCHYRGSTQIRILKTLCGTSRGTDCQEIYVYCKRNIQIGNRGNAMWPEAILQIKSTNSGSPPVRYSPPEDGNARSIDYISVIVQLLLVFNFSVHTKWVGLCSFFCPLQRCWIKSKLLSLKICLSVTPNYLWFSHLKHETKCEVQWVGY